MKVTKGERVPRDRFTIEELQTLFDNLPREVNPKKHTPETAVPWVAQKWFEYEAQVLIPYISNGPLIFWMYPVFGIRGATWFLGVSEWLIAALLFLGYWNKKLGILGALGSCATFISTVTIIPFMPNGWDPAAGFPAMAGNVPFLMKDVVLLAVSFYLLKQDVMRVSLSARKAADTRTTAAAVAGASLTAPNR